jgi:hypothetical protein
MASRNDLTAGRLRELLDYDPGTGVFRWRANRGRVRAGGVAGSLSVSGYLKARVDGRSHWAHRLAWLYVHGEWPRGGIDHINGDRSDNRIGNLRDVPQRINAQNRRTARRDNTSSGLLGVDWHAHRQRWRARIRLRGGRLDLGHFDTPEAAHAAYVEAKRRLHEGNTL